MSQIVEDLKVAFNITNNQFGINSIREKNDL